MMEVRVTYTTDIEPGPRSYRDRLAAVADALDALHQDAQQLQEQIAALEQAGIAYGTLFWDRGPRGPERDVMKLNHDRNSPTRPDNVKGHEYIGKDPERQAEAKARVQRGEAHRKLLAELSGVEGRIAAIERKIKTLELDTSRQGWLPGFKK